MRIFVSPLDWGLGHAARCIPIIRHLAEKNIEVVIGAEGQHLTFLKEHFPNLDYIEFPGYRVSYSACISAGAKVLLQLPKMISAIKKEHALLENLVENKKIDAVISDNRYGLWNKRIPSAIITHQLNIQAPVGNNILSKTIQKYITQFDECWVPDYKGEENLSGALSHPTPKYLHVKYIGPLSRFDSFEECLEKNQYDLLVILSGPEPQRSKLEEIILKQLKDLLYFKTIILQGLPGSETKKSNLPNVEIIPHLSDEKFIDKVANSEIILSRPGYSTIMDLHKLGWKKSIFIPTSGQTEQEYLGKRMQEKGMAITCNQKGFSLKEAWGKVNRLTPAPQHYGNDNYTEVIDDWIKKVS